MYERVWRVWRGANTCYDIQIGLLEPKYLPTGPQTDSALKSVRFPTHQPRPAKSAAQRSSGGPVMSAIKDNTETKPDIGAGTTSPQNPNEA